MAEGHGHVEHHWEYSYYPLIAVAGIFFALPLGFASYFEYGNSMLATIFLGIGVPLIVIGVAGWTAEGVANAHREPGYAMTGLPIFIVSETMIFLSLFASYWMLRLTTEVWPPAGTPEIGLTIPLIMTVILVSSSFTYHAGELKLEAGDMGGFKTWLLITMVLGAAFVGCTVYEYSHLIHEGFVFGTNAKSTAFYSITGFHASHVTAGLGIFIAVLIPALAGKVSHTLVKGAGLYWHFVDVIWFFVVSQIYFW
ncbi:MAG: heme-copper oxidase subunit III [Nitrospinae bacterium]|nr:heme-copper oxidase subunit III [Nitrospinota bacterium]